MKTEIRIYHGPSTDPVELFKLKVALKRKGTNVIWMNFNTVEDETKAVSSINALLFKQIFEKGIVVDSLKKVLMTCGDTNNNPATLQIIPTSEIYIGMEEILAVL